jgi:hypothetical protein
MFARIFVFSPNSDAALQFVQAVQETTLRMVREMAGCVATFVELRGQLVIGVSIWKSTSDPDGRNRECYSNIENMLRPFLKCDPERHTFKVREIGSVNARARAMVRQTSVSLGLGCRLAE